MKRTTLPLLIIVIVVVAIATIAGDRWYRQTPTGQRHALLEELQPVALANCDLQRFGESNDGGYLLCANLLKEVQAGYSYGISGYDGWGCAISRQLKVSVHEYDCFDVRQPVCDGGALMFHAECVAGQQSKDAEGRVFDTPEAQIGRNGDGGRHLVIKIDVEGAEWDVFLKTPQPVLDQIDQLAVEFHGVNTARARLVLAKLKQTFYIANLHFNNYSCAANVRPFPAWAYEVLLVNKRLGIVDIGKRVTLNAANAPNNPAVPDCQSVGWMGWFHPLTP